MSFYAVRKGKIPGIYLTWADCSAQVTGYPGAIFKKFGTKSDAQAFVEQEGGYSAKGSSSGGSSATASVRGSSTRGSSANSRSTDERDEPIVKKIPRKYKNIAYTDGSSNGFAFYYKGKVTYGPVKNKPTNNRSELTAIQMAIEMIEDRPLLIRTDSLYSINVLTGKYNAHTNLDIIDEIDITGVIFEHVKGHSGEPGNELVDKYADKGNNSKHIYEEDVDL